MSGSCMPSAVYQKEEEEAKTTERVKVEENGQTFAVASARSMALSSANTLGKH